MNPLQPPPSVNPEVYWVMLTGGPEVRSDPRGLSLYWKGQHHYFTWWEVFLLRLKLTTFHDISRKRFKDLAK